MDKYESVDDPEAMLQALRESGIRIDLFTFMQKLPDTSPKYAYPMEWDNVAALPVSTFDHWWTKQINSKTRNVVRLAEKKGIVVREVPFDDALVAGIAAVYNESPVRQGKPFWHYGKDVETVRRENGTFLDRSIFIGAFLEEKLVGFAKLVCDEDRTQAGLMQIVSMIQHRDKAADERADRPSRPIVRRTEDPLPRVRQLRLRKQTAGQPERFQAAQRLPARRSAALLSPAHRRWAGRPSAWDCTIDSSIAFPNRCSPGCETLDAGGTGVGFRSRRDERGSRSGSAAGRAGNRRSGDRQCRASGRSASFDAWSTPFATSRSTRPGPGSTSRWACTWDGARGRIPSPIPCRSATSDGDVVLVFSGEEFAEPGTARRLKERGHRLDVEGADYLVHLYEEDPSFPAGLNGRFHGLLADRTRRTATLFNDRYGMHRVYYHESTDGFYFAAEAKAILAVRPELGSIDSRGLGELVSCGCVLENRTLVRRDLRPPRRGQVGPARRHGRSGKRPTSSPTSGRASLRSSRRSTTGRCARSSRATFRATSPAASRSGSRSPAVWIRG